MHPGDHVTDFKPGILDAHGHAVLRAGASERQQVAPWLEYTEAFRPQFY